MRRRDATRVIHDILLLGRSGASKTQVIYKANLSFHLAEEYISFLISKAYLQLTIDVYGVHRYLLTAKGRRLLGLLLEIEKDLDGFFPKARRFGTVTSSGPTVAELVSGLPPKLDDKLTRAV